MGFFDFLSKNKVPAEASGREIARLERLVSSKFSQNFDRQEAIEELGRMGTSAGASALLRRFDWTLDPSITDQEEKEACLRGITACGEAALEPIREYCKRAESLMWPLKVLQAIVPKERLVEEILAILDLFDTEYVRNVEPKVQLISALESHPNEDVRIAVEPFLNDASEPVRFTAVNTIFAIGNPQSIPALVAQLDSEESLRTRNRIALGLAEQAWQVPEDLQGICDKALPEGFQLINGVVHRT